MRHEIITAVRTLESLRQGDRVRVTADGRTSEMVISRTARRSDGAYGSVESTRVTVTYGPGRYAREITAEGIASGRQTLELAEPVAPMVDGIGSPLPCYCPSDCCHDTRRATVCGCRQHGPDGAPFPR